MHRFRLIHYQAALRRARSSLKESRLSRKNTAQVEPREKNLLKRDAQKLNGYPLARKKSRLYDQSKKNVPSKNKGGRALYEDTQDIGTVQNMTRSAKTRSRRLKKASIDIDEVTAEEMVLYKDGDIIALNKPGGLPVHSGPKVKNDLSQHLHFWQYGEDQPPELAHRLDKDTSGVLLLTRHKDAARRLAGLFKERQMIKKYWAVTVSVPDQLEGTIRIPLSTRNIAVSGSMNRVVLRVDKMADFSPSDRERAPPGGVCMAETEYRVLSVCQLAPKRCCLMEVTPVTGFKHQIRVHLADGLLCPILGDHKFAGPLFRAHSLLKKKVEAIETFRASSLHLHAREVVIPEYFSAKGKPLIIKAPPPGYFVRTTKTQKLHCP